MKHIIRKAYWDNEKEENWLNEMASKGLSLYSYSWCKYVFEETPKGEYIYRIEYLEESARHPESQAYLRFMEDMGVECVATYMHWAFFRKKAADGPFDLYSDIDSKVKHYKRIRALWIVLMIMEFVVGIYNMSLVFLLHSGYTSGLYVNFILGMCTFFIGLIMLFALVIPQTLKINRLKHKQQIQE